MINTYSDAQNYLDSLIPNAYNQRYKSLRLERIEHLLSLINNPHRSFQTIHVGGTSGKGSTAYLISTILTEAGYKTGLHISPHLQTINERMQINNQPIPDKQFTELVNWIKPSVDNVAKNNPFGTPSYFEVLVALSFEHFQRNKINIAVIEVGLGGALDATNVIQPLASVITNIDLDHTEILGDTVEKIAADKAGIIKNDIDVITAAKQETVIDIIQKKCLEKNASLLIIGRDINYQIKQSTIEGSLFDLQTNNRHYRSLKLSLLGRHQVENAVCAIVATELIGQSGFIVEEKHIRTALGKALFPGRMEIIKPNPTIILDGAHNPAKMRALIQTVKELFNKKIIFILGFKKRKDIENMIKQMMPTAKKIIISQFFTTIDTGKSFSVKPEDIHDVITKVNPLINCELIPHISEAIKNSLQQASPDDIICVTGSLYLVGEARNYFS